jgi:RimJ/RimL family protein N-acetyltransferase
MRRAGGTTPPGKLNRRMQASLQVRRLVPADAPAYRRMMLTAYAQTPDAFTSTVAEREGLPLEWWQSRMQENPAAGEVVFGAFIGEQLAGVAGLMRESRERTRHKATLFGMVVEPHQRGRGLGRALIDTVMAHARSVPGLRVVQLSVTQGNNAAQRLYLACGFVEFGIEPMATITANGFVTKVHMWREVS